MTVTQPRHLYIGSMRPMVSTDAGIDTVCGDEPEYDSNQHSFVDTLYISRTTCIPCLSRVITVAAGLIEGIAPLDPTLEQISTGE